MIELWSNDRTIALLKSVFPQMPHVPQSKKFNSRIVTLSCIINALLSNYRLWEHDIYQNHYDGTILGLQHQWLDHGHNSLANICWALQVLKEADVITFTSLIDSSVDLMESLQQLTQTKITKYILFYEDKIWSRI